MTNQKSTYPRPEQGRRENKNFLELIFKEVSQTVDVNTPFDWGGQQKDALKTALYKLFSDKIKQSFKNGIEVGQKRASRKDNPWQAKNQSPGETA